MEVADLAWMRIQPIGDSTLRTMFYDVSGFFDGAGREPPLRIARRPITSDWSPDVKQRN